MSNGSNVGWDQATDRHSVIDNSACLIPRPTVVRPDSGADSLADRLLLVLNDQSLAGLP
jgi:hypothetical protein